MSYSQEVTLKLTIKGTLNGMKTIINTRDLNKLLDTAEGRATLLDKGRFDMARSITSDSVFIRGITSKITTKTMINIVLIVT